jgi:hypothetical protein
VEVEGDVAIPTMNNEWAPAALASLPLLQMGVSGQTNCTDAPKYIMPNVMFSLIEQTVQNLAGFNRGCRL